MLNKVILMGRLTRDPELRYTQTNIPVASFTLAVDRTIKGKGEQQQTADFIDIVAWRTTAEFVSKWFAKGRMMAVVGSLQVRSWQDKDGNSRKSTEVIADEVFFGDSKRSEGEESRFRAPSQDSHLSPSSSAAPMSSSSQYSQTAFNSLSHSDFEEISDDDEEQPF